ncbi:MAG: 5-carboxymethyl-2-hydroxymuconate Delta-isomerase [Steroidobacteraceae bacterium]
MTLEYSANLRADGRIGELCRELAQYMTRLRIEGEALFPPGGVRVRAVACEDFCIADGSMSDAGFVHAVLKIGAGRSDTARAATCAGLFDVMKSHFAERFGKAGLALSLELCEFSESGTLKHNNLHARFKAK